MTEAGTVSVPDLDQLRGEAGKYFVALMRYAIPRAAGPLVDAAKAAAPRGSGLLARSIVARAISGRGDTMAAIGLAELFRDAATGRLVRRTARGRNITRLRAQGHALTRVSARDYAHKIEFGVDRKGNVSRKAGPAHFFSGLTKNTQAIDLYKSLVVAKARERWRRKQAGDLERVRQRIIKARQKGGG